MTEWLVMYGDGETPRIHAVIVAAETMAEALQEARARDRLATVRNVWACVRRDAIDVAPKAMARFAVRRTTSEDGRLTMHRRDRCGVPASERVRQPAGERRRARDREGRRGVDTEQLGAVDRTRDAGASRRLSCQSHRSSRGPTQ